MCGRLVMLAVWWAVEHISLVCNILPGLCASKLGATVNAQQQAHTSCVAAAAAAALAWRLNICRRAIADCRACL